MLVGCCLALAIRCYGQFASLGVGFCSRLQAGLSEITEDGEAENAAAEEEDSKAPTFGRHSLGPDYRTPTLTNFNKL